MAWEGSNYGFVITFQCQKMCRDEIRVQKDMPLDSFLSTAVFCPGFQKGRVPSEKGTLAR